MLVSSGVARILSQGHGVSVHESRQKLHKFSAQSGPRKKPGLSRIRGRVPSPEIVLLFFDLKMASFDAFLVVFYAI